MNDIEKRIQQHHRDKVTESTDFFYGQLVASNPHGRLPEDIFVGVFLPYFSGQKPIAPNVNVFADWISIAGSPMNEVDIIDQAQRTLFTVPALFDTNIFQIATRNPGNSFTDIMNEYGLRNDSLPVAANRFLHTSLDRKAEEIKQNSPEHLNSMQRWNLIFQRYGIQTQQVTNVQHVNPSDDLEYD
jgi:hypothetical protein